ncbi:MAG: hypothetical protein ACREMY_09585 [bacterium]
MSVRDRDTAEFELGRRAFMTLIIDNELPLVARLVALEVRFAEASSQASQ